MRRGGATEIMIIDSVKHIPRRIALLSQLLVACGCLLLTACGPKQPVFYPNDHFRQAGQDQARMDMSLCMEAARQQGIDTGAGRAIGNRAVKGAAVGGATSAVVSAVMGSSHVLRSAGAGAAGGATAGVISGLFDAGDPDTVFKRYVERCLREKGYDVIGWQ